jgi:transposase-like protein
MAKAVLSAPQFQSEAAAFAYVEARLWPNGPVCRHCGETERVGRLQGKTTRPGLYKCYRCRKPFTVRMGTIFESSHLPLHLWLQVIHLMCASKKGIASRQIQRMLQCSMKTAWFLTHRIREAMNENPGVFYSPLGGDGSTIEVDETYVGGKAGNRAYEAPKPKQVVMDAR